MILTAWFTTQLVQAAAGTDATADDDDNKENKESNNYTDVGHVIVKATVDTQKQQLQKATFVLLLHSW